MSAPKPQQEASANRGSSHIYDESIATLALCELLRREWSSNLEASAQAGIYYLQTCRNPYAAWRYQSPPIGDNDSSVTGWTSLALHAGREAGLKTSSEALVGALSWFYEVSDPATGRAGYMGPGGPAGRVAGVNDHFPAWNSEAMTAVALTCFLAFGDAETEEPMRKQSADLLLKMLPEWDPEDFQADVYYAYFGTEAMSGMGGRYWKAWRSEFLRFALDSQRKDGGAVGSWDPAGPWGMYGGRVYSTAMQALSLVSLLEADSR